MDIRKIAREEYIRSIWSGGATTQIGIYPEDARYEDRDFLWRISSATVDLEESSFTSLKDYDRIIMVLKGQLQLKHNEQDAIHLDALQPYSFDGGYDTVSRGRVEDFNLMMRKNSCTGYVHAIRLSEGQTKTLFWEGSNHNHTVVLYAFGTAVLLLIDGASWNLEEGESLVICQEEEENSPDVCVVSERKGALIMADVKVY